MREDCDEFLALHPELASFEHVPGRDGGWYLAEQAGHDFWLTRNGHGAGFWDRGLGALGETLTKWAKAAGTCDVIETDTNELSLS